MGQIAELTFFPIGAHIVDATLASAETLTPPDGATQIVLQALTQNIRLTLDGTTPTSTTGFQIKAGDPPFILPVGRGKVVKVIEEAASATLQAQWGGYGPP